MDTVIPPPVVLSRSILFDDFLAGATVKLGSHGGKQILRKQPLRLCDHLTGDLLYLIQGPSDFHVVAQVSLFHTPG